MTEYMETTQSPAAQTNRINESDNERLLYNEFKRKINAEAARSQIRKLEYDLAEVTVGSAFLKSACADAVNLGVGGVCVLPAFVRTCSSLLGEDSGCSLVACISSPHGGDTTALKVKAIKRALRDGADEVEVTAPLAYVREGNMGYVRREFRKLRSACKKRALRIDVGSAYLTRQEIERVCGIAADCGANSVRAGGGYAGATEVIAAVKGAVKDRCTVKAEGISTVLEMSSAVEMGATVIGSKNAAAVARAILSAAQNET